jgi:hypothetical protein
MNAKPKKFETRLTVSLTGQDYEALTTLAGKDDVSASWLVRRAVGEYLRQRDGEIGPSIERRPTKGPHVRHAHRRGTEC